MALWRILKSLKMRSKSEQEDEHGRSPKRRRTPLFAEDHGRALFNLKPNHSIRKPTIENGSLDKGIQAIPYVKNTAMNSNRPVYKGWNYYHREGGWSKDINVTDPEILVRARKKLEKEEAFQNAMPILTDKVELIVKHNNSMLLYSSYFKKKWNYPQDKRTHPYAHVICDFLDPSNTERAVSNICWANNYGRMGVAYCPYDFDPSLRTKPTEAYFFDVEIPSRPEGKIKSPSQIMELHYHSRDPHNIIAAMYNGQVATWDTRTGVYPQCVTNFDVSHEDMCTTASWINSKTGSEFLSGGLDGQVLWWDERYMDRRLDQVWLDPEKGQCRQEYSLGCAVLEYDQTLPTKFVVGTEQGNVMLMMRKGKSANERLIHCYAGHRGRIRSLHRNPLFIKNILSTGQDCIRIFAEDCRESSIMWTAPKKSIYSYAHWLPTRPSVIVACRLDGHVDFWDLLKHPAYPYLTTRITREQLTCLWPSDSGKFVAVGTNKGKVRLLKPADHMTTFSKNDRAVLAAVFEREARREKFLEQRHREIRLRKRDKEKVLADKKKIADDRASQIKMAKDKERETGEHTPLPDYSNGKDFDIVYEAKYDPVLQTQRDFYSQLENEIKGKGLSAFLDKSLSIAEITTNGVGSEDRVESTQENSSASDLVSTESHPKSTESIVQLEIVSPVETPSDSPIFRNEDTQEDS